MLNITAIFKYIPNIPFIEYISSVAAVIIFMIIIWRCWSGDEASFWIFKIKPDQRVKKLLSEVKVLHVQFEEMDKLAKQKGTILKVFSDFSEEINNLVKYINSTVFDERKQLLYRYLLPGILSIITKDRANSHRISILVADEADASFLKMLQGFGYSVNGQNNLRLEISNSYAGAAFRSRTAQYSGDITKDRVWRPNPRSSRTYHSLACIPICGADGIYGILNIDGETVDSFGSDDIDYLCYFSNMLAIVFQLSELHESALEQSEEAIG